MFWGIILLLGGAIIVSISVVVTFFLLNKGVEIYNSTEIMEGPWGKTEYLIDPKSGINLAFAIDHNCWTTKLSVCSDLKDIISGNNPNLEEYIERNNFTHCTIVRLAKNNCQEKHLDGITCHKGSCSTNWDKENRTNPLTLPFWIKVDFYTTKNSPELTNPNIERFLCIEKHQSEEVFCIRKLLFKDEYFLFFAQDNFTDYANEFLSQSVVPNTILPGKVAQNIDLSKESGFLFFNHIGERLSSFKSTEFVVVLDPIQRITLKSISLILYSELFECGICTALGIRELDKEETELVKSTRLKAKCLYERRKDLDSEVIYAVGRYAAASENYAEIKDPYLLNLAFEVRSSLFLNNEETVVPEDWIKLTDKIYVKKNSSLEIKVSLQEAKSILESDATKSFLEDGGFLILKNEELKDFNGFKHYKYENQHLVYKSLTQLKFPISENIIAVNLQFSRIGQGFLIEHAEFESGKVYNTLFSQTECDKFAKRRAPTLKEILCGAKLLMNKD